MSQPFQHTLRIILLRLVELLCWTSANILSLQDVHCLREFLENLVKH